MGKTLNAGTRVLSAIEDVMADYDGDIWMDLMDAYERDTGNALSSADDDNHACVRWMVLKALGKGGA